MKISQRAFSRDDAKQQMSALVHQFPSDNLHLVDLPYRFSSWAFDEPSNVMVWLAPDHTLAAWAVLQTPFWTIDYACNPEGFPQQHAWILDWADRRARQVLDSPYGRPSWYVNVFSHQAERIVDLERAGFACQSNVGETSWSKVFMSRARHAPLPTHALPAGYRIRPLGGAREVAAYVELHQAVFQSKNMTEAWRRRVLQHPEYHPLLDLVAEDPTGHQAAFCIGWFDAQGPDNHPSGQIEPLGVHAAHRKLGLGQAILCEGVRRLHEMGAEQVFVETDNYRDAAFNLYESAGFRVREDVLVYRKDYSQAT